MRERRPSRAHRMPRMDAHAILHVIEPHSVRHESLHLVPLALYVVVVKYDTPFELA